MPRLIPGKADVVFTPSALLPGLGQSENEVPIGIREEGKMMERLSPALPSDLISRTLLPRHKVVHHRLAHQVWRKQSLRKNEIMERFLVEL